MALPLPCVGLSLHCHSGLNHRRVAEQWDVLQVKVVSPLPYHHFGGMGITWAFLPLPSLYLCPPEAWGPGCTPRHWIPILVASYDTHGIRWGYSEPRPPLWNRVRSDVMNGIKYTELSIIWKLLLAFEQYIPVVINNHKYNNVSIYRPTQLICS
jgi:hypothetical protein